MNPLTIFALCIPLLLALAEPQKPAAPPPTTAPVKKPAKRIVYLLDASGSMLNYFDDARSQVYRSISDLKPDQFFTIILDSDYGGTAFPSPVPATDKNKAAASAFLDKSFVRGENRLMEAMQTALKAKPDVIWWLTDGDVGLGDDARKTAAEIRKLNTARVRINTFAGYGEERDRWIIWKLATDSGGRCIDANGQSVAKEPATADSAPDRPPAPANRPNLLTDP